MSCYIAAGCLHSRWLNALRRSQPFGLGASLSLFLLSLLFTRSLCRFGRLGMHRGQSCNTASIVRCKVNIIFTLWYALRVKKKKLKIKYETIDGICIKSIYGKFSDWAARKRPAAASISLCQCLRPTSTVQVLSTVVRDTWRHLIVIMSEQQINRTSRRIQYFHDTIIIS